MKSYEAARGLLTFLGFLAWCGIIVGIILAIGAGAVVRQMSSFGGGGNGMAGLVAAMPGFILAFLGFLSLALVQIGRAGVDTAEYTQQMLKIARDQLDVSRQALKQDAALSQSFVALQQAAPPEARPAGSATYEPGAASDATKPPVAAPAHGYVPGDTIIYRTKRIRIVDAGYEVKARTYATLEAAQAAIDEAGRFLPAEPQLSRPKPDPVEVAPADLSASFKRS
ncbi:MULTISPECIES: hypothetical protein [Roseobacteraceae]|uniref:hypothetical protein n=1 Tax=Roseobacteraceae TaxID=2854170 RepID=UPI002B267DCE|nr:MULTISPECIES: hypothetical protein [Roseobacteraceae]